MMRGGDVTSGVASSRTERLIAPLDGARIYALAAELYPICRSITGDGVRKSLDLIEPYHAPVHLIEEAAWRRNQDIHALAQTLILPAVTDASEYNGGAQVRKSCVIAERRFDLCGEFAGRLEHQRAQLAVRAKARNQRQCERGSFSSASLCRTNNVATRQNEWNGAQLNRRRIRITGGAHAFKHLRRKTKLREWHRLL